MTTFRPAYRITVYAPRDVDQTEATVLTPASSAPHSDAFQLASIGGVAGFVPYLGLPTGRNGRFDPLTKKTDIGSITFELYDIRTAASNIARWVTAFVGDETGYTRLKGLKVYAEESLNGGTSWSPYFVGRIQDFSLKNALTFALTIREASDELKYQVFVGKPHSSIGYEAQPMVLPIGISAAYANLNSGSRYRGFPTKHGNYTEWEVDTPSRTDNVLTSLFGKTNRNLLVNDFDPVQTIAFAVSSGAFSDFKMQVYNDYASGDPQLFSGSFNLFFIHSQTFGAWKARRPEAIYVKELPVNHPEYTPLTRFTNGVRYRFSVHAMEDATISEDNPLLLNNIHPITLLKDIVTGSFGYLFGLNDVTGSNSVGDRKFSFPVSASSFTTLEAKPYPRSRWNITQPYALNEFVEKYICQPYHVGYRIDPAVVGGIPVGVFTVFDCRKPSGSLLSSIATITDDDCVAGRVPSWNPTAPLSKISLKYYGDRIPLVKDQIEAVSDQEFPDVAVGGVSEDELPALYLDLRRLDAGVTNLSIDALGVRGLQGEVNQKLDEQQYTNNNSVRFVLDPYIERFADGPVEVTLTCLRTANTNACRIGDWRLIDVDYLPNPQNHTRGQPRLMQCTERSEQGLTVTLRFLDAGENVQQTAPLITSCSLLPGQSDSTIRMTISSSVDAYIQTGYALTDVSASSRPVDDDNAWVIGSSLAYRSGSYSVLFTGLPSNTRVWPRARSLTYPGKEPLLPSAYVFPAIGKIDTSGSVNITSLAYSNITATSVDLGWSNNGDSGSFTELQIASPATASMSVYTVLAPGSTMYTIFGLTSESFANPYKVALRHMNGKGAYSVFVSASFTLSGSTPTCPDIGLFYIEPNTDGLL